MGPSPMGLGVREAFPGEEEEEAILEEKVGVGRDPYTGVSGPEQTDKAESDFCEWFSEGSLCAPDQRRAGRTWLPVGRCAGQGRVPGPVWVQVS